MALFVAALSSPHFLIAKDRGQYYKELTRYRILVTNQLTCQWISVREMTR
jgi:hypothetical protein